MPVFRHSLLAGAMACGDTFAMGKKRALPAVLALAMLAQAAFAESFGFNTNDVYPRASLDGSGFEDRIIAEGLRRLGHTYEILRIPSERALVSLQAGLIDGDYVRISGLESLYPGIVRVSEPVSAMEFVAFSLDPGPRIDSWEDLRGLEVAHIRGWKIVEERTRGFPRVTTVRDEMSLFSLLSAGKVDAVVYERLEGERFFRQAGRMPGIRDGVTLERRDMYLYLSKSREALAGPLADAFRAMRSEGLIDKITADVLKASRE